MSNSRQQIRQLIRQKRQSLTPEFQQEAASRLVSVIKENRFAVELKHKKVVFTKNLVSSTMLLHEF